MRKERCTSEKATLTDEHVRHVVALADEGGFDGLVVDYKDTSFKPFCLRARGRNVAFYYRTRSTSLKVGDGRITRTSTARLRAAFIDDALGRGKDPKIVVKHFDAQLRICGDELKAAHETQLLIDPSWNEGRTPGWTLSELREVYLADALKKLGTRWSSQVRSLLDDNLLAQLDRRHVRDLELIHLQPVIKQGQTANVAISRLYRIAQNFKLMLRWGAENHSGETGLDPRNDWWRLLKVKYSSNEGTNEPSLRACYELIGLFGVELDAA